MLKWEKNVMVTICVNLDQGKRDGFHFLFIKGVVLKGVFAKNEWRHRFYINYIQMWRKIIDGCRL